MDVKSRKQGTSIVVTIPAEFHIPENTIFEPKILEDGTLQFVPKLEEFPDIWNDSPEDLKRFNEMIGNFDDGAAFGREDVEY
ncbi:MAG: hypothetical protein LBM27_03145 [Lactobacillaceae bacterium]|nr:hypothetical protein [Lactobacillaceae bacterium]